MNRCKRQYQIHITVVKLSRIASSENVRCVYEEISFAEKLISIHQYQRFQRNKLFSVIGIRTMFEVFYISFDKINRYLYLLKTNWLTTWPDATILYVLKVAIVAQRSWSDFSRKTFKRHIKHYHIKPLLNNGILPKKNEYLI